MVGGTSDIASSNGACDFKNINNVPFATQFSPLVMWEFSQGDGLAEYKNC